MGPALLGVKLRRNFIANSPHCGTAFQAVIVEPPARRTWDHGQGVACHCRIPKFLSYTIRRNGAKVKLCQASAVWGQFPRTGQQHNVAGGLV